MFGQPIKLILNYKKITFDKLKIIIYGNGKSA